MSEHLNRIRRQAGVPGVGTSAGHAVAVAPATLANVRASATQTRTDLTSLRVPATAAAISAAVAATLHRFALATLLHGDGRSHALPAIAIRVLDFAGTNVWAPFVAGGALVLIAVVALRTSGFSSGTLADAIAAVVGLAAGALAALPVVVALAYGLVILAGFVVLCILAAIAIIFVVIALLSEL